MAAAESSSSVKYGVPGLGQEDATLVTGLLQDRLNSLNDLALTLKHWNVVGPQFIGVHTMLDPQVDAVRLMVDQTVERIATLRGSPCGTPGALVAARSWDDYSLGRDDALAHMGALDVVYPGVIEAHRKAIEATEEPDPVTQDMLIGQAAQLEQYHWFVRAHLESPSGSLATPGPAPNGRRRTAPASRRPPHQAFPLAGGRRSRGPWQWREAATARRWTGMVQTAVMEGQTIPAGWLTLRPFTTAGRGWVHQVPLDPALQHFVQLPAP